MNESLKKNIIIIVLALLCLFACMVAGTSYSNARRLNAELDDVRRVNSELAERNRQLELANSEYQQRLDSIASRVASAQDAAGRAGDSVSKIRAIVDAIDDISQDLRKPLAVSQP